MAGWTLNSIGHRYQLSLCPLGTDPSDDDDLLVEALAQIDSPQNEAVAREIYQALTGRQLPARDPWGPDASEFEWEIEVAFQRANADGRLKIEKIEPPNLSVSLDEFL